ncbi:helix-turn-helix domain-containing protein [Planococcus beigongshangi]|uniref:helix-turn-helix domain-containing protein n=1 Tax=Planococcus beigongshangi TaxID=2782536 RepID=UPI00193C5CFD|nr:helix-turn-helix transcriptional regulator [Planococcus beigongshangi]
MKFGEYIKKIRTEKGLSMRELERRSGISQSYISQLEKGSQQNPKTDTIQKLANGLNTSYKDLMEKAGIIEVDSLMEAFGFNRSSDEEENLTSINNTIESLVNDIYFHLNDESNLKTYKTITLDEIDRDKIKSLIENYLIRKLSNDDEEDNRHLIKIIIDENFQIPGAVKTDEKKE